MVKHVEHFPIDVTVYFIPLWLGRRGGEVKCQFSFNSEACKEKMA